MTAWPLRLDGRATAPAAVSVVLVLALLAAPLGVVGQPAKRPARVAMMAAGSAPQSGERGKLLDAFVRGMRENGYVEGKDFVLDLRFAGTRTDEADRVMAGLVAAKPDVIVTVGSQGAWAAKKATSTIPIVMAVVADPVGQGLVASLAQPGGNITGNAILTEVMVAKRLELLHEVVPRARRIASLENTDSPVGAILSGALDRAGERLGLTVSHFDAASPGGVDAALEQLGRQRPGALIVGQDNLFYVARAKIVASAARQKIPAVYAFKEAVLEGGLMSYANSSEAMFQKAGTFVVRVLKGARPADLPVEQPTKFELVINLRTASALGLAIPASVRLRADEVLE